MQASAPALVVIAGATGVGKTALGVELCQRLGGEIVGADSVQIYRGLDIGSSKLTAAELGGVRHHLLDVLAPDQGADAACYAALADAAIADSVGRGHVPVIVGGTGLWLRALLRGLLPLPAVDPALRARLQAEWRADAAALHSRLASVDAAAAAKIHPNDHVRVVRALEVYEQTGAPISELRAAHALGAARYRALTLVLDDERQAWQRTIGARTRAMIERGWLDEVRELMRAHGAAIRPLQAVGYRQLVEHLGGGYTLEATIERIERATRLYGKRQRNWFRSEPGVDLRLDPAQARSAAVERAIARHVQGA
jgi:tRNA dimethylallyltransferase